MTKLRNTKACNVCLLAAGVFFSSAHVGYSQWDALKNLAGGNPIAPTKKIAYFEVQGVIRETPSSVPPLFGGEPQVSLKTLLSRLKEARQDANVVAVVVDLQDAQLRLGQLEELYDAMHRFSAGDKDVWVHADGLHTLNYAAATGASHISVVPTGDVWLMGLYGEVPYLRGMLDKLGVLPDFEHCGDFKTGAEPITNKEPSEQARKMNKWLLDSLYENLVALMAEGRGTTPEKMRQLIDGGPYSAEEALKAGLIDSVKHREDFIGDLKKRYGATVDIVKNYADEDSMKIPDSNIFAMFEFIMKMLNPSPKTYTKESVAIVYVDGPIATGEAEPSLLDPASEGAFSTTIRKALRQAAEDDSVKAVVLRVDSPGGSALASEIILDATKRVAAKKPLIVSMGNVAGSGGYYVTCASDTIFADKNTITASIGVLGGKLVTTSGWDKLGIHWHAEQRGAMAGLLSSAAPFTDQERAKIRHYMDTVYDIFKKHVVAARGDRLKKPIDELAGGRVFSGTQALELGLVDKIGGLEEALKFAAKRANLSDYDIRVIPEPPTIFDLFMRHKDDDEAVSMAQKNPRFSLMGLPAFRAMLPLAAKVDPLRVRAILRAVRMIELIHEERAALMMPDELLIR